MTAAIGLYCTLGLPEPWRPLHTPRPLIIYGASSAVGSFAIKLAQLSNIHPIIAVAGKARELVESLIDRSKGDTICDYRNGSESLVSEMREALETTGHDRVEYAFDCVSDKEKKSHTNILQLLDPKGQISLILDFDRKDFPESMTVTRSTVRWVHQDINTYPGVGCDPRAEHSLTDSVTGCREFAHIMFRFFSRGLEKGFLKGHPYEVSTGGLGGIERALNNLKSEKASGMKYVFQIADTPGV